MVRLSRIYTKTGDRGETALGDGARVPKHSLRVAAYGTVDEANAAIGLVRLHADGDLDRLLAGIQNDLFDLGADLCRPEGRDDKKSALRVSAEQVARLEHEIDTANAGLAPLESFVLPGGTTLAAYLHLARTIVRRAEREMTALGKGEALNPEAIRYANRLSDLLFVLARQANGNGARDVLWQPGANR